MLQSALFKLIARLYSSLNSVRFVKGWFFNLIAISSVMLPKRRASSIADIASNTLLIFHIQNILLRSGMELHHRPRCLNTVLYLLSYPTNYSHWLPITPPPISKRLLHPVSFIVYSFEGESIPLGAHVSIPT